MKTPKLELVSFPICPYVQRSVITLKHKKADFKLTFIDLEEPPTWFDQISPLGQVPILRVQQDGPEVVLFESAVINEYLDETIGKPMHSADPLVKARDRAWIEIGSGLIGDMYMLTITSDAGELDSLMGEFFDTFGRVEAQLGSTPFWRSQELCLTDAAWAPLFVRLQLVPKLWNAPFWKQNPKTRAWAEKLIATPEVKASVRENFAEEYVGYLRDRNSAAL